MTRLFFLMGLCAAPCLGQSFKGQPIYGIARAGDGDSLEVNGKRLRLFGANAPEFDQSCTKAARNGHVGRKPRNSYRGR